MALDRLLASLEREAVAQAEALRKDADARAAALRADAEARAVRRTSETLEERARVRRIQAELALARARRAARGRILEARARLLDRVFDDARPLLADAVQSSAYRAGLPARIAAARAAIGEGPAVIRCAPVLAAAVRKLARGVAGLTVEPNALVATGFVMARGDGALDVDETLERRLEARRHSLALAVLRALEESAA